ncbi:MAG: hypothetical protein LBQ79_08830 [Deltaproteobacteria bacterium]|nr:hypothetical protein [Deltaproteobacteria bacterium]
MKFRTVVLALVAAAAFQVWVAPFASAESPVTFSGYLRLRTFALGGFFSNSPDLDKVSDRFAVTRLRVNVSFKPTDNVEIRWRFHGPHAARWGTTATGGTGDFTLYSLYFFGIVKTDWGTISAGRVSSDIDSAGLKTLGYTPAWGFSSQGWIFDRDSENDGVMYYNEWENGFGLKAFYVKRASRPPYYSSGGVERYFKDADYDRVSVEPFYKWESGAASLAVQYDRNSYDYTYGTNIAAVASVNPPTADVDTNYVVTINPALIQSWAVGVDKSLTFHAEAKYAFGKRRPGPVNGEKQREITQDGFGAYADLTLSYPQGDASLAGWYFRGNDAGVGHAIGAQSDYKDHGLVNAGEGFYPFLLFNYGNSSLASNNAAINLEGYQSPGHWAAALLGNHKLNDYVTLNYAVGTFRKTNDYYLTDDKKASRSLGSEIDLGLTVKIMDNLLWQTKFALFDAGHYYSDRYDRPEFNRNIWGWANEFLFTF